MKSSASSLNPFALSYTPLAKRDGAEVENETKKNAGEAAVSNSLPIVDDFKLKGHPVVVAHTSPSGIPDEMSSEFLDEESEMDLAYLQMLFSGVSDQSLADVYNVNRGDLEAAIEMLTDMECAEDHPDTLNSTETEDSVSSGECSSVKAVNVAGEFGASGSSDVAVASS